MRVQVKLIRHAQTKGNEQGRYVGARTDESLSGAGVAAIKKRKNEILGDWKLDETLFFTSPMKRCIETLQILVGDKSYEEVSDFKEIDFGDFENLCYEELNGREDYQSWIDSGGKSDYPHGEPLADFIQRNNRGFFLVLDQLVRMNRSRALVVCHGGSIMAILSQLTKGEYFDFQVGNGEGFLVDIQMEEGQIADISYNRI